MAFATGSPDDGVRHIIERLAVELLLGDDRVGHPQDDAADVAARQLGRHQVRARLLERRGDRDAVVDVIRARRQIEVPGGDPRPDILQLVLLHEPLADVGDVDLVPIELVRAALEIGLHVGKELVDVDLPRLERDLLRIAEAKFDRRPFARRLRLDVIEAAPVADDLVEPVLAEIVLTWPIFGNGPLPGLRPP